MIRDAANLLLIAGAVVYCGGYAWAGVMAYRLKKWGWLFALLFIGPISYPFFAIINRKSSRITFRMFWVGLALLLVTFALLVATKPQAGSSVSVHPQPRASRYLARAPQLDYFCERSKMEVSTKPRVNFYPAIQL